MRVRLLATGTGLLGATIVSATINGLPVSKVYGVNLGGWLLAEPGLVQKLGQEKADKVFAEHWTTWFTEKDVDAIAEAGLNSVRIPLGYWIVESLVDRSTEFYPRGGMKYLKKGLGWLKRKGIHVMLDHHALPGVSARNQMFAGRCTSDVQFYTDKNYRRALIWAGVMTVMTHIDPDFSFVFSIEAINEPLMDANQTPGYGDYQKRFVKVVRMVEYALGIKGTDTDYTKLLSKSLSGDPFDLGILKAADYAEDAVVMDVLKEVAASVKTICTSLGLQPSALLRRSLDFSLSATAFEIAEKKLGHGAGRGRMSADGAVVAEPEVSVPHGSSLERNNARRHLHHNRAISATLGKDTRRTPVMTAFPNRDWQYNNPPNPADAAIGPQLYDAHLYFSFGGVADPNAESYLRSICNSDRVSQAAKAKNTPLVFGEWSLATNFNASAEFLFKWADAQKTIYAGQADGWIFWTFKIEEGSANLPN
ncbi:glycoside hydrolase family 5 protein, partial [Rhizoctonia solani 123E]